MAGVKGKLTGCKDGGGSEIAIARSTLKNCSSLLQVLLFVLRKSFTITEFSSYNRRLAEVNPAKVGTAEDGPAEADHDEVSPNEDRPTEVGSTELTFAQVDLEMHSRRRGGTKFPHLEERYPCVIF